MMRIGKTQPSSRYCLIWAGVRHFGVDPRDNSGQRRTGSLPLHGPNGHGQPFPDWGKGRVDNRSLRSAAAIRLQTGSSADGRAAQRPVSLSFKYEIKGE